jgi:hypothetical protein
VCPAIEDEFLILVENVKGRGGHDGLCLRPASPVPLQAIPVLYRMQKTYGLAARLNCVAGRSSDRAFDRLRMVRLRIFVNLRTFVYRRLVNYSDFNDLQVAPDLLLCAIQKEIMDRALNRRRQPAVESRGIEC